MFRVELYVYDLSHGMVRNLSRALIGKQLDGLWHTGIVVHQREIFYGGGIQTCAPGTSMAGKPSQVIHLGNTDIDRNTLDQFLAEISPNFTPEKYDLFHYNCNNFTDEVAKFILGTGIPEWITGLPAEVLSTPFGQMIVPMLSQFQNGMRNNSGGMAFQPVPANANTVAFTPAKASTPSDSSKLADVNSNAKVPSKVVDFGKTGLSTVCSDHPHRLLKLNLVSMASAPLISRDTKASQYVEMIKTYSQKLESDGLTLAELEILKGLSSSDELAENSLCPKGTFDMFERIIAAWPSDGLFSILSLFRLVLLRPDAAEYFAQNFAAIQSLLNRLDMLSPSAQLMLLCVCSNLFIRTESAKLIVTNSSIVESAQKALKNNSKVMRVMGANVLFNLSLFLPRGESDVMVELVTTIHSYLEETDVSILNRLLLALGHLLFCNPQALELLRALEFPNIAILEVQQHVKDIQLLLE